MPTVWSEPWSTGSRWWSAPGSASPTSRRSTPPAQRYSGQVFLRELAVCIWGEDLRPGLPRTKPSAAVAAGFHTDSHAVLARARETLGTSTDPEVIRRACRIAARRMVQVAFAVVMAREGAWATVLEEQAAAVGAAFPQWAEAARRAAEQGRRPVADAGVVRELLDSFGRWAEDALDQAVWPSGAGPSGVSRALQRPSAAPGAPA